MEGTVDKGLKRSGKVQSKDTSLRENFQKGKSLKSPKTKCENVMKVGKTMGKTDSKSDKNIKSLKTHNKNRLKKKMKLRISTKTDQKNNENTRIPIGQGVLKKKLENKELTIAKGKKTKSLKIKNKSKSNNPNVPVRKRRPKLRSINEIGKKNYSRAKRKLNRAKFEFGKEIPIVKTELSESQAKRKLHKRQKKGDVVEEMRENSSVEMSKPNKLIRKRQKEEERPITLTAENNGSEVSPEKVSQAVQVLLQLFTDSKKNLFSDEAKYIYLYIKCMRIPMTPSREVRIVLPHSLLPEKPDVCLFSSDLQKGKRVDHEPTLEHVKNILAKHGITEITEVITLRQLKTEYDQFEMKRALCSRFDLFLSDAKVSGHIVHLLGKTFYTRKKVPVPIKMDSKNLKKCVQTALHKTSFRLFNNLMLNLKVAHTNMTPKQIQENIIAATAALHDCLPGGWNNVACLTIRGVWTLPVPIYMSTIKENEVPKIKIRPKRPKAAKNVVGELPGVGLVLVTPDGNVKVIERETYRKRKFVEKDENDLPPKRGRVLQSQNKQESDESDVEATDNTAENDVEEDEDDDNDNVSEDENEIETEENEIEGDGKENEVDGDKDDNVQGKDTDSSSDSNENESSGEEDSGLLSVETTYLKELKKKLTLQKPHKKKSIEKR